MKRKALVGWIALGVLCFPSAARSAPAAPQRVPIVMSEFKFEPRRVKIKPGLVRFELVNRGVVEHDFLIVGMPHKNHASHLIKPGKRGSDTVTLKSGRYQVVCSVPGHREAGMQMEIVVSS